MVQTLSSTVSTQSLRPNHVLVQCVGVTTAARTKRPGCESNNSGTSEEETLRMCGATPHSPSRRGAKLQQGHLYFYATTQFSVYGLDGPGIESPWGRDFPPVQTGPGAQPAFCTMGTGSFPGSKCGRGVLLTTHPLPAPRAWKSRAIPLTPSGPQPLCCKRTPPLRVCGCLQSTARTERSQLAERHM
jgi:hypothetical protein